MGFLRPAESESGGSRAPLSPASALSLGSYLNFGSREERVQLLFPMSEGEGRGWDSYLLQSPSLGVKSVTLAPRTRGDHGSNSVTEGYKRSVPHADGRGGVPFLVGAGP